MTTLGTRTNGTVNATGTGQCGDLNVIESWNNIQQVDIGHSLVSGHTIGLKSDGTVEAVGKNEDGQCDVESWTDIQQVAGGDGYTVGLKSDGTVIGAGRNDYGQLNF